MNNQLGMYRQAGVAMVEFAIVLPLMIMLLFGITELGRALYQQNTLDKAVNTGARYMSRLKGIAEININDACVGIAPGWATGVEKAQKLVAYGGNGSTSLIPGLAPSDVTISARTGEVATTDGTEFICVIQVSAKVEFAGLFGDTLIPFTNIGKIDLHAETEERYIGL